MKNSPMTLSYIDLCCKVINNKFREGLKQISKDYPTTRPKILLADDSFVQDDELLNFHNSISSKNDRLRNHNREVLKELSNVGIDFMLIKGTTFEEFYPVELKRRNNDCDLVVKDEADFWRLCETVRPLGYYPYGIYYVSSMENESYGFAKFASSNDNGQTELEVSFGGFSECTLVNGLPAEWLWKQSTVVNNLGSKYRKPTKIAHFVILLTELYRKKIHMRDVLDYFLLMEQTSKEEKQTFIDLVQEFCLQPMLNRLSGIIKKNFEPSIYNEYSISSIAKPSIFINFGWMIRRNCKYLFPYIGREFNKLKSLQKILQNYSDEIWNEMAEKNWFQIVRFRRNWHSASKRISQNRPILLMYLGDLNQKNGEWKIRQGIHFLSTPIGVFHSSIDGFESDDELERIMSIYNSLLEER